MRLILYISLLGLLAACSPGFDTVQDLGKTSDFSDVEPGDDFTPPEDDEDNGPDSVGEVAPGTLKPEFFIESGLHTLAHGKAERWDGCNKLYFGQGGYTSDTKCGKAYFHPLFSDYMNNHFTQCVQSAAKAAGQPAPVKIFVNHLGSYNDRPAKGSTRLSNHAYARALDIQYFNMYDAQGKLFRVSTLIGAYSGAQAQFYDAFRSCWRSAMPKGCTSGQTEYQGSIGHTKSQMGGNSLHSDHIHLSLPLCAG